MTDRSEILLFAGAPENPERGLDIAKILEEDVQPIIERILRSKLHVSLRADDCSKSNQDALEIAGDVRLQIIAELQRNRSNGNSSAIKNLRGYTHTVTLNSFRQYLRERFPARRQLKSKLRYLLSHHPRFALWEIAGGWACAFRTGSRTRSSLGTDDLLGAIAKRAGDGGMERPERIIKLVGLIFEIAEGWIDFECLVEVVSSVQGLTERIEVDVDTVPEPAVENRVLDELEMRESLLNVWNEIRGMSQKHRTAVLMNLRDRNGGNAIGYLPLLGIASIRTIAETLGFGAEEFAGIWNELPWDDLRIAERLGVTRQQVINLRQSARARLVRLTRK
jgi:hypothetical protein